MAKIARKMELIESARRKRRGTYSKQKMAASTAAPPETRLVEVA
jgi:hypothetical protein